MRNLSVVVLDGDELRAALDSLRYDIDSRKAHARIYERLRQLYLAGKGDWPFHGGIRTEPARIRVQAAAFEAGLELFPNLSNRIWRAL